MERQLEEGEKKGTNEMDTRNKKLEQNPIDYGI